ncbi:MAG: hypothetical protein JJU29_20690, partial [Verrucomicrobia bacterium]|nr:hypothetical protein [Verrucomicrobiota bacterium]
MDETKPVPEDGPEQTPGQNPEGIPEDGHNETNGDNPLLARVGCSLLILLLAIGGASGLYALRDRTEPVVP